MRFGVNGKGLGVRVVGAGLGMWVSGEVWLMSKCFKLFVHALEALRCIAKEKREREPCPREERERALPSLLQRHCRLLLRPVRDMAY